jgi:poly [ADP-ribose] polymerase
MARVQTWKQNDPHQPTFSSDFSIAEKAVLQVTDIKSNKNKYYAIELHTGDAQGFDYAYRVFTHYGRTDDLETNPHSGQKECRYFATLDEAMSGYQKIYKQKTSKSKGYKEVALASSKIGSVQARGTSCGDIDEKTLERIEVAETDVAPAPKKTSSLTPKIRDLVRYIYDEAVGALTSKVQAQVTANGIETPLGILSVGQIEKGESILEELYDVLNKKRKRNRKALLEELSSEFYTVIPHRFGRSRAAASAAVIQSLSDFQDKQETLQLMKDMLQVNGEAGAVLHNAHEDEEYAALGCEIKALSKRSKEYKRIEKYVIDSQIDTDSIEVSNVFTLRREDEHERYLEDIGNDQLLFHGSRIQNWMGILSRGILMPKVVVSMGVNRTDAGWLGNGIYFGNTSCTSAFYASPGQKGTSFMAVNRVALGKVKEFSEITYGLEAPPEGFDSCHGIRGTEFEDDEFVVYNEAQQKLAYLVEFTY